ncbi:uncharacterized protein LOC110668076 isoform X2 [Hevea brasiliensis]|uniref:uncharacterized protein LOC110668076 isoform X2 n=1 Tax=Hevea brasiliensis TaxID=3981 RepID=UPI0025E73A6D|nr:uncharacterized protein LOC110668076 isoform X2 [Hevea brasiliensis]
MGQCCGLILPQFLCNFMYDVFLADTRAMKLNVWKQLASEEGKEIPDDEYAQRLMLYAGADHALHWETAESEVDRLKLRLSQLYYYHLLRLRESIEGLKEWLDAVLRAGIPCAVVSSLDRINMVWALERMGLKKYFQVYDFLCVCQYIL